MRDYEIGTWSIRRGWAVRLNGSDGTSFSAVPIGYEFPETDTSSIGEVDWLVIEGQVVSASENWSFRTTSLIRSGCGEARSVAGTGCSGCDSDQRG